MKQNVFKKSVASLIMALILIVALLVGFTLTHKFDAKMVIWEKIDYKSISEKYNIQEWQCIHLVIQTQN